MNLIQQKKKYLSYQICHLRDNSRAYIKPPLSFYIWSLKSIPSPGEPIPRRNSPGDPAASVRSAGRPQARHQNYRLLHHLWHGISIDLAGFPFAAVSISSHVLPGKRKWIIVILGFCQSCFGDWHLNSLQRQTRGNHAIAVGSSSHSHTLVLDQ